MIASDVPCRRGREGLAYGCIVGAGALLCPDGRKGALRRSFDIQNEGGATSCLSVRRDRLCRH